MAHSPQQHNQTAEMDNSNNNGPPPHSSGGMMTVLEVGGGSADLDVPQGFPISQDLGTTQEMNGLGILQYDDMEGPNDINYEAPQEHESLPGPTTTEGDEGNPMEVVAEWPQQQEMDVQQTSSPSDSHPTDSGLSEPPPYPPLAVSTEPLESPDHLDLEIQPMPITFDGYHDSTLNPDDMDEDEAFQGAGPLLTTHTANMAGLEPANWAFPGDSVYLQPLHPIMSNLSSAGNMTPSSNPPQVIEEDSPPMPVGDPNSGETLPTTQYLFSDPLQQPATGFETSLQSLMERRRDLTLSLQETFTVWRGFWSLQRQGYPYISKFADERTPRERPHLITPTEMKKDGFDMQGIHWDRYKVTSAEAREVRRMTFKNYANLEAQDLQLDGNWGTQAFKIDFTSPTAPKVPSTERFFNFRSTNTKILPRWWHYQLRHNIFAASQNAVYYHIKPTSLATMDPFTNMITNHNSWSVACYNPQSLTSTPVMTPSSLLEETEPKLDGISTLTADCGVLVVGSVLGVYGMRSLNTAYDAPSATGHIVPISTLALAAGDYIDNSTNHVYTTHKRPSLFSSSSSPNSIPASDVLAIFSSNDKYIRTLDCATNQFLSQSHPFNSPVNCACSSPDARLRLLVSDDPYPVVADAETGEQLYKLPGHSDHGFACAWAPDYVTLATAHQDGIIQIFDARNLSEALARIPCEQSGARALQFSPLGSGKPVLIATEPADFVHVIDAAGEGAWERKQSIEFFGDVAGASLSPDGQTLWIGCSDRGYGGLMEFGRDGGWRGGDWAFTKRRLDEEEEEEKGREREGEGGGRERWGYGDWNFGGVKKGKGKGKERERLRREDFERVWGPSWPPSWGGREDWHDMWKEKKREERERVDWVTEEQMEEDERCVGSGLARWRRGVGSMEDLLFV